MIWYICAAAAALCIIASIFIINSSRFGSKKVFFLFMPVLLATFVVYIPPYFLSYDFLAAIYGSIFNLFQVISLEAGLLDWYEFFVKNISAPWFVTVYTSLIAIVHFALPAVSAVSAITLLMQFFASLRLSLLNHRKRAVFVFSEINEKSESLARDIRATMGRCDIVFADISDASEKNVIEQELNCIVYEKSIDSINIKNLSGKDVYYFCITDNADVNLNNTLHLIKKGSVLSPADQQKMHVFLFASGENVDIMLDSSDKGEIDIHVVNEIETIAYDLLNDYPLYKYATDKKISILICGLGDLDKAFLRAALWCGQMAGYSLKINVVGVDIEEGVSLLELWFPGIFSDRYDVNFYPCANDKEIAEMVKKHCSDANYIVINRENDEKTVDTAILFRRMFYTFGEGYKNAPPIFAHIRNSDKAEMVSNLQTSETNPARRKGYDITPFGHYSDIYTYKSLVDSDIESIAKNVHLVYEDIFSEGEIDVLAALGRYKIFEVNKRSNRANAMHIRYKLAMLGLDYIRADGEGEEVELADYLDKETLEKLSYAEHNRWMAFLETEGWASATIEQVAAYKEADISKGRHNCPLLQLHPYICAYEELPSRSEKLALPDSTVHDRELIARIPDILGDKWDATGKKFKIIKQK